MLLYGFGCAVGIATDDDSEQSTVLSVVAVDPLGGQYLIFHRTPLRMTADFIEELVKPNQQWIVGRFGKGQVKLAVGLSKPLRIVITLFKLIQCPGDVLDIDHGGVSHGESNDLKFNTRAYVNEF